MSLISAHYQLNNYSPDSLWSWLENQSRLIVPPSIEAISFDFYHEITGSRYGFRFLPPWEVLPQGSWYVLIERLELKPASHAKYRLTIDREEGMLYAGDLDIHLHEKDGGTEIEMRLDGTRKEGLASFSDDFIGSILRQLIRESWESVHEQLQANKGDSPLLDSDSLEREEEDHMAPLAVAAGVFSAGMALSLWMWRRKRRDHSI